jgi:hypothetical protein
MFSDNDDTLRRVAWSEICPWLKLFRCFRLSIGFGLPLFLSALAILLTIGGWSILGMIYSEDAGISKQFDDYGRCPWLALTDLVPDRPQLPSVDLSFVTADRSPGSGGNPVSILHRAEEPFWGSFTQLSRPLRQLFASDVTSARFCFLLLCGLWTLAVWAFFGAAITRRAAVELAGEEHVGFGAMMRYAASRWLSYFAAPLILIVIVLMIAGAMGVVGGLLRWDLGVLFTGLVLWPFMLLGGLAMTFLLAWLGFGWPLMWATISTEGEDSFHALSRSQQYLFQRPLQYLFYVLVAVFVGWLGWLVVSNFAAGVVGMTAWAADWGADSSRWMAGPDTGLRGVDFLTSENANLGAAGHVGAGLLLFWCGCVKMLAVGFLYSYFWTASTCIYLLLRRDADATEIDEVFLEDEDLEPSGILPPMETDEAGAPVVTDDVPPDETQPGDDSADS